jgi:hypothetical protein
VSAKVMMREYEEQQTVIDTKYLTLLNFSLRVESDAGTCSIIFALLQLHVLAVLRCRDCYSDPAYPLAASLNGHDEFLDRASITDDSPETCIQGPVPCGELRAPPLPST